VRWHDAHALQLRHTVEVVVGGEDGRLALLRQSHQLGVDGRGAGIVLSAQLELDAVILLQDRQHVHASTPTVAAAWVRVVSDVLQLSKHEARDHEQSGEEARGDDIDDAPIDDGAGVEIGHLRERVVRLIS